MTENKKIRVIQYGCGKMGKVFLRYVTEHGGLVVGAIDNNVELVGKDIAEIMGTNEPTGVLVSDDAEKVFAEAQADVAIIATTSLMSEVEDQFVMAAKHGVNAISTCEESFYPFTTSKEETERLDKLAKENDCTLTGSGYQDVFWGNLVAALAGATHKITKISGVSSYNVEDYGIALAKVHGAGLTLEEFEKEITKNDSLPSYMWNSSQWLCDRLGLNITEISQKLVPTTYEKEINSSTLGMVVPAGRATGMSAVVTTKTAEGIEIVAECIGKIYAEGEVDRNDWKIEGEPNTSMIIHQPATVNLTCATVVNRLPDLMRAPTGFIPTSQMPMSKYLVRPLEK